MTFLLASIRMASAAAAPPPLVENIILPGGRTPAEVAPSIATSMIAVPLKLVPSDACHAILPKLSLFDTSVWLLIATPRDFWKKKLAAATSLDHCLYCESV